jgi:hypothetical protein
MQSTALSEDFLLQISPKSATKCRDYRQKFIHALLSSIDVGETDFHGSQTCSITSCT